MNSVEIVRADPFTREGDLLLQEFRKNPELSSYQIFNLEEKPQYTIGFYISSAINHNALIYRELAAPTAIVRAHNELYLGHLLEHLSQIGLLSFLLFIETNLSTNSVEKLVKSIFECEFSVNESIYAVDRHLFQTNLNELNNYKNIELTKANKKDLSQVYVFYNNFTKRAYNKENYLEQIENGRLYVLNDLECNKILAMTCLHAKTKGGAIIGGIRMLTAERGRGLGRFLISNLTKSVLSHSNNSLLYIPGKNYEVITILKSLNYRVIGNRLAFDIKTSLRPFYV